MRGNQGKTIKIPIAAELRGIFKPQNWVNNHSRAVGYETQFEQSKEEFEDEVADILWQLNKLCWVHKINLEEVFLRKLEKNADR